MGIYRDYTDVEDRYICAYIYIDIDIYVCMYIGTSLGEVYRGIRAKDSQQEDS